MKTSNRWLSLLGAVAISFSAGGVLASSSSSSTGCIPEYFADGDCDSRNNTPECGYDSGDCCERSCVDTHYTCGGNGGFQCIDPDVPCVDDDDITVEQVENCIEGIGNGYCDESNNLPECSYDGGDCCECTCVPTERTDDFENDYQCSADGSGFDCEDPSAPCIGEEMTLEDDDFDDFDDNDDDDDDDAMSFLFASNSDSSASIDSSAASPVRRCWRMWQSFR